MRSGFNLRNSVAHKRACLYLYRTLLKQCRLLPDHSSPTPPPPTTTTTTITTSSTLHDLIRARFRHNKTLTSQHAITASLTAGRSALSLLVSSATGSSTAVAQLASIAHSHAKSIQDTKALKGHYASQRNGPRPSKLKKIAHLERTRSKFWAQRIPNPIPILQRPVPHSELPDPSRPRKIPDFIAAQGIPFLRYKSGPQSPELSRIIRQYNARDQRRWDLLARLLEEIDLAVLEDAWDGIVAEVAGGSGVGDMGREGGGKVEERHGGDKVLGRELPRIHAGSWAAELKAQVKETQKKIAAVSVKRTAMSQKMWDIVVREKELAEQEKLQRREMRRKERKEMKQVGTNTDGDSESESEQKRS